jgi:DNA gyrase subunit A
MNNINKNTVEFVDNYDGSEREPNVLPALFPNMLANGSSGIAVGMATNIPPHNLNELVAAIKLVCRNPNVETNELRQVLKGPDFPTGAEILGTSGIDDYFNTGKGTITLRSKYSYKTYDNGKSLITITEIPYMVTTKNLEERITDLVNSEAISGISNIGGGPTRDGLRFTIETKRDVIPEVLMNQLFKTTQLQSNFSVNILALVNGEPKVLNIRQSLQIYIDHQLDVLNKRVKFDLNKNKERAHILEGLHIATGNIDLVIKIIRESENNELALKQLMSKFNLTEIQGKAILDMKLRSLSSIESNKIEEELKILKDNIIDLTDILAKRDRQINIIETELDELVRRFGDERKTAINQDVTSDIDDEDLIPVQDIIVTMSSRGYLNRLPIDTYRSQKRGGVGVIGLQIHEDDDVEKILATSTHTDLLFFTDLGKIYRVRGHQIPIGSRQAKGIPAINIIDIEKGEKILSILPVDDYSSGYLFFATLKGIVKKTSLSYFERINRNGKIAITLKPEDKLFKVVKVYSDQEVYIGASNGNMVRFIENQVRAMGRTAAGVFGMKIGAKDNVVGLSTSAEGQSILSIGAKAVGKITPTEEYRLTRRNAKGVRTLLTTNKTGKLVYVGAVNGNEDALLITSSGKVIRFTLSQIRSIGRSTQGVKLMNIDDNDKIQSVTLFKTDDGQGGIHNPDHIPLDDEPVTDQTQEIELDKIEQNN